MMARFGLRRILNVVIVVLILINAGLLYRAFRTRADEPAPNPPVAAPETQPAPAATPEPDPMPTDPQPERTLMLTAMTFFQSIADERYDEAAGLFQEPEKREQWSENLNRVAKMGNPISAFEIEKALDGDFCAMEPNNARKGHCRFPILLFRRDHDVREWAAITMHFEYADGRWGLSFYNQEPLDKDAYDKRIAEERKRRETAERAREKLRETTEDIED